MFAHLFSIVPLKAAVQYGYSRAFHCPSRQSVHVREWLRCWKYPPRGQTWTSEAKWKLNYQQYQASAEWTRCEYVMLACSICLPVWKGATKSWFIVSKYFLYQINTWNKWSQWLSRATRRNGCALGAHGIVGSRMVTTLQRRCWERPVAGACRPYITASVIKECKNHRPPSQDEICGNSESK